MAGFNFVPPPGPLQPMNLQQMALQAFRPPPPMGMGGGMPGFGGMMPQSGMGGPTPQQGAGMLGNAMGNFKGFGGAGADGLPTSGLGNMTGNAAQNASLMNLAPGNASFGDLGGTGFQPAFDFLGGGGGAAGSLGDISDLSALFGAV